MKSRKKPSYKIWIYAVLVAFVMTLLMSPTLEYIYPLDYRESIETSAKKHKLDEYLVMGIISAESNFDTKARSHKDAHGLMQITEETAMWCIDHLELDVPKDKITEPEVNIEIGCAYMRYLIDKFDGNVLTAIAAFNAGPGNVDSWLSDPRYSDGKGKLRTIPFSETAAYVSKVQKRAKIYKKIYG